MQIIKVITQSMAPEKARGSRDHNTFNERTDTLYVIRRWRKERMNTDTGRWLSCIEAL